MLKSIAAMATLLLPFVAAQASTTVTPSMPPSATAGFDVSPVPELKRFQWCLGQTNNCPRICGGTASPNTCDETTLEWSCVCDNGTVPDVSAYQDTVPYFQCEETYIQCIALSPNNAQKQKTCKDNRKCGSLNATAVEDASESDSASSATSAAASAASETTTSAPTASPSSFATVIPLQMTTGAFAAIFAIALAML